MPSALDKLFFALKKLQVPRGYYGKYRGKVKDVDDPRGLKRIRVFCPKVYKGSPEQITSESVWSPWALPCSSSPTSVITPSIDSWVWVEFEGGDKQRPLWVGFFWPDGKTEDEMGMIAEAVDYLAVDKHGIVYIGFKNERIDLGKVDGVLKAVARLGDSCSCSSVVVGDHGPHDHNVKIEEGSEDVFVS